MRKFKKFAAALLGAAMVLTSMTVPAMADAANPVTTDATIDDTKKGSLTVHKYEYNGDWSALNNGTGEKTDANSVPAEAQPLVGATFSIYKITNLDGMKEYYSTNPTALPSWDAGLTSKEADEIGTYVKVNSETVQEDTGIKYAALDSLTPVKSGATNNDGSVAFNDLDLGFYLVLETAVPDSVSTTVDPFIVSVPMTQKDGTDWLYDVHVYPKNKTTYGKVDLVKEGVNQDKLSDITFRLDKQTENTWTSITNQATAAGDNTGDSLTLTTNADGKIHVEGLSKGTYRFVEVSTTRTDGYIVDSSVQYIFKVSRTGVVSWDTAVNTDASGAFTAAADDGNGNTADAQITVTNYRPDLDKEVQKKDGSAWGQDADYSVGDMVPYKITVDVPQNIAKLGKFEITDTPTNLKDKYDTYADTTSQDPYKMEVKHATANGEEEVDHDVFKVKANANTANGFTVYVDFADKAKVATYAGKKITIYYYAELLDSAVVTTVGNPNNAKLEYTSKINEDGIPSDSDTHTIEDNAVVYTFKLTVVKRGQDGNDVPLQNVKFDLYREALSTEAGAKSTEALAADTTKPVTGLEANKYWVRVAENLTTDADGLVSHNGLSNGTYYLVETETAEEYNLLKAPVEVTLAIQYTTHMTETWEWEDGKLVKHEKTSATEFANTDLVEADNTQNPVVVNITENQTITSGDGVEAVKVINKKGFELPLTGGMGTIIFTFGGIALALAGFMIIMASRKKTA